MKLKAGCPKRCEGWVCVDINPLDPDVIKDDILHYLAKAKPASFDQIVAENLIEHLKNVGSFFAYSYDALRTNGILKIVTDNAEFFPFYVPKIKALGFSAHAEENYRYLLKSKGCKSTSHYAVFTKLHLRNYCRAYNFHIIELKRVMFGARLQLIAQKV